MLLTEYLGTPVVANGEAIRSLTDLAVSLANETPAVLAFRCRCRRGVDQELSWSDVIDPGPPIAVTRGPGARVGRELLWLAQDVLDTQVLDLAGMRLARVADVELSISKDGALLCGVDLGLRSLVRRLGLRRLATHLSDRKVGWDELHFVSGRVHELQLNRPRQPLHELSSDDLTALAAQLPAPHVDRFVESLPARKRDTLRHRLNEHLPARRRLPMHGRKRAPS
jgi:hypothetical protein